jgi:catechol 2,3-dioxygenase-like lactoylglutathione lyase family enzyme
MDIDMLFAGTAVGDFDAAVAWYTAVLGRAADVPVTEGEVMWRLADSAFLYVVRDPERAGGGLLTLSVADLDLAVAEVAARGIDGARIERVGGAGRRVVYLDPDGNELAFVEVDQDSES